MAIFNSKLFVYQAGYLCLPLPNLLLMSITQEMKRTRNRSENAGAVEVVFGPVDPLWMCTSHIFTTSVSQPSSGSAISLRRYMEKVLDIAAEMFFSFG